MSVMLRHALLVGLSLFALTGHAITRSPGISTEPVAESLIDAELAYEDGLYARAAELYKPHAEKGVVKAQIILGSMYYTGLGVTQDYAEAARLFLLAAHQGDSRAQLKLGSMYEIGLGVHQDNKEAAKWCRLAAEQGDVFAQLIVGALYDHGKGVPRDYSEAVKWYRLAAEQGNVFAQEKLGWKYLMGDGVAMDEVLAYMWLDIAASNDSSAGRKVAVQQRIQQRDAIARGLTAGQIARARELSRKCQANKFHGCI